MNRNAPIFAPNAQAIRKRLKEYTSIIYERIPIWTYDQSAQVVLGIDSDSFNQTDADNFIALSEILSFCAYDNTISPVENTNGTICFKPLDVINWAIHNEYKLSKEVSDWYEEECSNLFNVGLGKDDYKTNVVVKFFKTQR